MQLTTILLALVAAGLVENCHAQNDTCYRIGRGVEPLPGFNNTLVKNIFSLTRSGMSSQEIFVGSAEQLIVEPSYDCFMQYWTTRLGLTYVLQVDQYTDTGTGVATHNSSAARVYVPGVYYVTRQAFEDPYMAVWTTTDYETFGVVHWCSLTESSEGTGKSYEHVVVFTGEPHSDEALLTRLRDHVTTSLGFPTEYAVQINHHSGCDYNVCQAVDHECCDASIVNAPPKEDIFNPRLYEKNWYVQEIFFAGTRKADDISQIVAPSSCHVHFISQKSTYIQFRDIYTPANASSNSHRSYELTFWWDEGEAVWTLIGHLDQITAVITHTDHDGYGVMHWCPFVENTGVKSERVLTFTISPHPDEELLQELRDKVASFGFPTTNNSVQIHHHDECDYEYHG